MKIKACVLVIFFSICLFADNPISIDSADVLIRKYMVTTIPNLSTTFVMKTTECAVDKLWEQLKIQLFFTQFTSSGGTYFRSEMFLYHRGTMRIFGYSHGRLMSGVMLNKTLYLTYSWGSGIRRTHVCRFFLEADSLKIQDNAEGFIDRGLDLFAYVNAQGKLSLERGDMNSFNTWVPFHSKPVWYIDTTEHAFIKVVDSVGNVIPGWSYPINTNPTPIKTNDRAMKYRYVSFHHTCFKSACYNALGRYMPGDKRISAGFRIVPDQRNTIK